MRYIEHIIEPDRLLLSWQVSQSAKPRGRMFVAELIRQGDDADLVYLSDSEEFTQAKGLGFECYPGFPANQPRYSKVLSAFMKRLPPRSRGDFDKYLNSLRIRPGTPISDFALLGYSGARLPDDNFTVIDPFENAAPPFEFLLYVQGYRYLKDQLPPSRVAVDQEAIFQPEPENTIDPNAVKVLIQGEHAGYICRGLTNSFHQWLARGYHLTAHVERINGTEDRPDVYLFVTVNP